MNLKCPGEIRSPGRVFSLFISSWAFEGAAEHGRIDMVQFLKNVGADLSESSGQLEPAFALATSSRHFATKRLLEEYIKS